MKRPSDKSLISRIMENTKVGPDCWEWQRSTNQGGYGRIMVTTTKRKP